MRLTLHRRLLLGASVVLAAFLGLTGFALDRAFLDSAQDGQRDRLQARLYALLAAAELDAENHLRLPAILPDARFGTPGSGLYGQVSDADGRPVWQSPSLLSPGLPVPTSLTPGTWRTTAFTDNDHDLLAQSFGVAWEDADGKPRPFTFSVAEDLGPLHAEIAGYRQTLWSWLGGSALLLLVVQGSILRWSLRPLRRVGRELAEIEGGARERLGSDYPDEIAPLTGGINRLLTHEQARLERYRRGLGDLAHSLKTPLAVLRGSLPRSTTSNGNSEAATQIDRMAELVEYHLQRAATAGRRPLAAPVALASVFGKIVESLDKVHHDKPVAFLLNDAASIGYRAERGDLLELAGNLLDNGYKWCRERVEVTIVRPATLPGEKTTGVVLHFDDDGPGIGSGRVRELLRRGMRADSTTPGHGLGLAIVNDIVAAYGGEMEIGSGSLGGTRVTVRLPG